MNELIKYYDEVIMRLKERKNGIFYDSTPLINAFNNLKTEAMKYHNEEIDLDEAKKEIKNMIFDGIKIREITNEMTKIGTAVWLYMVLDYTQNDPTSEESIKEVCDDLSITEKDYITFANTMLAYLANYTDESDQTKRGK